RICSEKAPGKSTNGRHTPDNAIKTLLPGDTLVHSAKQWARTQNSRRAGAVTMAWLKNAALNVAAGMIVFVFFFGTLESLVRVVYWVRNSLVSYVPLPYAVRDYGPV